MIFIVAVTLFSWFIYIKGRDSKYAPAAALILISGVFIFSSRMHERYLFPVVALAVIAYIYLKDKRFILLAGGFSITVFVNTYYVLFNNNSGIEHFDPVLLVTAFVNIMLFGYLSVTVYKLTSSRKDIKAAETVDNFIE
jgi:Gpi18-like mannosyltransferase